MAPEDWFIFLGVIALIPATIAYRKDRSFIAWWFFGVGLFVVALPMSLMLKQSMVGKRRCPKCTELIPQEAVVCKHCKSELGELSATELKALQQKSKKEDHVPGWLSLLVIILVTASFIFLF
jgi:hypothetical protein